MQDLIYKAEGISGDVVVLLPTMMVRIGILQYRLMTTGSTEDAISSYHDCSTTPNDHWRGYQKMKLNNSVHPVKQKTIDKWDIKVDPEIQPNLIQLVFDPETK